MKKNLKEGIKLYDEMLLDTNDPQIEKTIYERFEEQKDISEAKIYILLTNSYMASILLNAGEMHELGGSGYGWLLNSNALRGLGESTVNTFQDIDKSFLNILQTGAVGLLKREELDDEDI